MRKRNPASLTRLIVPPIAIVISQKYAGRRKISVESIKSIGNYGGGRRMQESLPPTSKYT